MNETLIERIVSFVVIVFLLFAIAKFKFAEHKRKREQRKRFERGNQLETEARLYLSNLGYEIISEQEIHYHQYKVDGENRESKLILDYVVKKDGEKYIVEVKSGKSAISLSNKNTRRQLLEYDFVIENDGIFLLDMENKKLQFVKFYTKTEKNEDTLRKIIIVIAIIGISIPFFTVKIIIALIMFIIWRYPDKFKNIR
jgi:hypothetical protein